MLQLPVQLWLYQNISLWVYIRFIFVEEGGIFRNFKVFSLFRNCISCSNSKPEINLFSYFSQMTAVHPVGEGQCIAVGYESVLPLVLLTLQGGDVKPYEFPTEGTKETTGTGAICEQIFVIKPRIRYSSAKAVRGAA